MNVTPVRRSRRRGTRLGVEYGSGNTLRPRASTHHALREGHGPGAASVRPQRRLLHQRATGRRCDREESAGARIKYQYRGERGLRIENTGLPCRSSRRGYPYARPSREASPTTIRAPTTAFFVSDGLTVRYDGAACSVARR